MCAETRVLQVVKGLGRGGAEQLIANGPAFWDRSRFAYTVAYVLPWKNQLVPVLEEAGVEVVCLGARSELDPRAWWNLSRLVRRLQPHILHAHLPATGALSRLVARRRRVPTSIYSEHNIVSSYRGLTHRVAGWTYGLADLVIAVSEPVAQSVREAGWKPKRLVVVENGVPPPDTAEPADRGGADFLAVHVGNIRPGKGHSNLIAAAARCPGVQWVSIGGEKWDGDLARVRAEAAAAGVSDRLQFLGRRDDVAAWLEAADVFIVPSDHEGLPVSMLEAMSRKVPVVSTAVGGVPDVIEEGVTGLLVPPSDPDALATAVGRLRDDRALGERLAKAGADVVAARFGTGVMLGEIERLYMEVFEARRRRGDGRG